MASKIRIRLKAFDHALIDQAAAVELLQHWLDMLRAPSDRRDDAGSE